MWDSVNELDLLRYHCFSSISLDDMNGQVKLWGPVVPIIALTKPQSFTEADLQGLVVQSTPDVLIKAAMIPETGEDDISHRLIHIIPNGNFASKYVTDLIYSHFKNTCSDRLQLFLPDIAHVLETNSSTGVLLDKLFERH